MEVKDIISSGLLELYACGMASEQEATQVIQWVKQYPEVADELNQIEKGLEKFAFEHTVPPSAAVKTQLFEKINNQSGAKLVQLNAAPSAVNYWKWIAAAAVVFLLGSVFFNYTLFKKYNQIEENIAGLQKTKTNLEQEAIDTHNKMHLVESSYSTPVSLHGMEPAPTATAKIFWIKATNEIYIDPCNLPLAPKGKQYQLWAIVDGKPVDGGMINAGSKLDKYHIQKMKAFDRAQAFAVTLESESGNAAPQGPTYVMGTL